MDSSKLLNIPSTIKDPNYRYKMPKIIATTQGSGGNVKTKLENYRELAHALTVPQNYPLKFIGMELGTQTDIKNEVQLINGSHAADKLQSLLDKFIEKYVLCPKCKLPEIRIFIKSEQIRCKCRACGTISKLDDKHKFSNFIKTKPPKYDEEPEKGPIVDDKETKSKLAKEGPTKSEIDKETILKIKSSSDKITKLFDSFKDPEEIQTKIEEIIAENNFELQFKYFVIINGVFNKNIYSQLSSRLLIIKNILDKEEEKSIQEATFQIVAALSDLTINRFKDLGKFVASILYYFYEMDIITEDFWVKYAIKSSLNFKSILLNREIEAKFIDSAKDFSHWIEHAPYEDEEEKVYSRVEQQPRKEEVKVVKEKEEEIDIDNI
jgi:translation initiation factor 2 beta subunit (eIF-2beta)/eIF-5